MKALLLFVLLLTGCASLDSHFPDARSSVVWLETETNGGSGNLVNSRCVVTADHVVNGQTKARMLTFSKHEYAMNVVAEDEDADIAVLCGDTDIDASVVTFAKKMPDVYTKVFTVGFPLHTPWFLTEGRYEDGDMISTEIAPGNSGGGVFDEDGHYMGFVDALKVYQGTYLFPHLCLIVTGEDVKDFLTANHIEYKVAK